MTTRQRDALQQVQTIVHERVPPEDRIALDAMGKKVRHYNMVWTFAGGLSSMYFAQSRLKQSMGRSVFMGLVGSLVGFQLGGMIGAIVVARDFNKLPHPEEVRHIMKDAIRETFRNAQQGAIHDRHLPTSERHLPNELQTDDSQPTEEAPVQNYDALPVYQESTFDQEYNPIVMQNNAARIKWDDLRTQPESRSSSAWERIRASAKYSSQPSVSGVDNKSSDSAVSLENYKNEDFTRWREDEEKRSQRNRYGDLM